MTLRQCYPGGHPETQEPGWWLHLDYDLNLIADLKRDIPATLRYWDEEEGRWWVHNIAEPLLRRLIPEVNPYFDQPKLPGL